MIIEVFNRMEQKYLIHQKDFIAITKVIAQHMMVDIYNQENKPYSVTNLYYDTFDHYLIRSSLLKPLYKEKLRIRAYGDYQMINPTSKVFVEIKKKFNKVVNKRRSVMTLDEATRFLQTQQLPELKTYHNRQVLKEIQALLSQYQLTPSLYLSYQRIAYFSQSDPGLRISFDTNLYGQAQNLTLQSKYRGELLLDQDTWLMEIKTDRAYPTWLTQLLTRYKIYPTSFSKYGHHHKLACQQSKEKAKC